MPLAPSLLILADDPDFVVVCKPIGADSEHDMPALLAQAVGGTPADYYPVHRLDKAVGGLMVYARNAKVAAALTAQAQAHTLQKGYLAAAAGSVEPPEGEMRDYLFKDAARQKAFPVKKPRKGVKEALLRYRVLDTALAEGAPLSLCRVWLHTGRFHQIRAQFAARKHPLYGDGKYGSRFKGTIGLFSCRLSFLHPGTGQPLTFEALPPADALPWALFAPEAMACEASALSSAAR